jgi:hypothetical protein
MAARSAASVFRSCCRACLTRLRDGLAALRVRLARDAGHAGDAGARMIMRLTVTDSHRSRIDWPPSDEDSIGQQLFSGRKPLRRVLCLIDADLLERCKSSGNPSTQTITPEWLLAELVEDHPLIDLYRYADDGPPTGLKPDHTVNGETFYRGWAIVKDRDVGGIWTVIVATDSGYSESGVMGNWPQSAAEDARTDAYRDLPDAEAKERRIADALASQVAGQALHVDLYITERPYVRASEWLQRTTTVCGPAEALTLLSLYLRAQDEFLIVPKFHFNRGLFFWVGTREILPAAWRWFAACVQNALGEQNEELLILGGSLLQRVDRALQARDSIHIALNQPQNNDLREDSLSNLDIVLVLLMSALDVAARVAHRALQLPANAEHQAGWQFRRKNGWLDQVRAIAPNLAAVVDRGTDHEHVLTIVRLLRNSVHGAALQGLAVGRAGAQEETLIGLPRADEAELLAAMDALGGRAKWGVTPTLPGRSHVDPGILVDRLFQAFPSLLNELMDETPVERLAHVRLKPLDAQPPDSADPMDAFATWVRRSIRWQLGL